MGESVLSQQPHDHELDITRDVCPMTFVRTRLALDRLAPGQVLLVRLRGEEPLRNVPRTAGEQGHAVLGLAPAGDGIMELLIRKAGAPAAPAHPRPRDSSGGAGPPG